MTLVTHCASVFSILKDQPHITLILCGGHYNPDEKVFYGRLTQQTLSGIYMNKVFLFPSAISLESGICDYQQELLQVEQVYLSRGEQVFILADSSKFEKKALLKLTDMQQEFCYITDPDLPQSLKELYQENHITLLTEVS